MSQLPVDCLKEIFEYLKDDKMSLYSCLLVNRIWCEDSVRILWRNICNYNKRTYNTLISCLPNESKENLYKNGIIISTPTSRPMFNYSTFCKILSIQNIYYQAGILLQNYANKNNVNIVAQEIIKMFIKQIPSLKDLRVSIFGQLSIVHFTSYPEAKDCLRNLTELHCDSDVYPEFYYHLSQICHNIKLLSIFFKSTISSGLTDLISAQQNLKYLKIIRPCDIKSLTDVVKLPNTNTITKLSFYYGGAHNVLLSFIIKFTNLQELVLSFDYKNAFEDFKSLQYIRFSQLKTLKIPCACPNYELLINFLEMNGNNLEEFYVGDILGDSDNLLNLAIVKYCTNLRKLSIGVKKDELETLNMVFKSCQHLEKIKIWCGGEYLNEKDVLDSIIKYSHNNISELILHYLYCTQLELLPEELESFFMNWTNRISQKSISLIIINRGGSNINGENMKIIEKYINLGVIKRFKTKYFDNDI
jgi:hypothetical protein